MKTLNFLLFLGLVSVSSASAATVKFNLFTVEVNGVKMWVPSTIAVKKGDEVEIKATNKTATPGPHGFMLEAFKVVETADENGKTIKFKADKAGIFPFQCHLHPAHVGGQLIVLK